MKLSTDGTTLPKDGHFDLSLYTEAIRSPRVNRLAAPVRRAITRTRRALLAEQQADGHWVAELEGDTILESETILLLAFFEREDSTLARQAAKHLLDKQLPDGGWAMYPGGGVEISGSVKAYFALKLMGHDASREYMQRAQRAILAHGGADAVNSFTRFYLALLGQISFDQCPEVPPELMLLPTWFPANLYATSAWSRTIIVPLSIVSAKRPVRSIDPERGIRELFVKKPEDWAPLRCPGLEGPTGLLSWDRFFRVADRAMKACRRLGILPLRGRAIKRAERWMLDRFEGSDGLGAIFPPIVWSLLALRCLGYDDESPEAAECWRQLDALVIEDPQNDSARLQPCKSPVWDTAITLRALTAGGLRGDSRAIERGVTWLLDHQVTRSGDWSKTVQAEPGGWCFEFQNDFYPDSDDTAMVLMALRDQFTEAPQEPDGRPAELRLVVDGSSDHVADARRRVGLLDRTAKAIEVGQAWMAAMQNDDGGWGAFDRNNNRRFLCHVPFADHNAMIDPSTPDVTGRVLEALGRLEHRVGEAAVDRAVDYLRSVQEADGSWFGRWGVNYIYGTWEVLSGLVEVGVAKDDPMIVAGADWLLAHQQPCGGWGESPETYDNPLLRGQGPVTASQTAWALLGLMAAGREDHPAVKAGVQHLVDTQQDDGRWLEEEFTGAGFPRVFYLRYHNYPVYFPLIALARWAASGAATQAEACVVPLRLVRADEVEDDEQAPHVVAFSG